MTVGGLFSQPGAHKRVQKLVVIKEIGGEEGFLMDDLSTLTKRELSVLELVARGKPNKAIAFQLGISENTVEKHLGHIYAKLNVKCRTEAAICFLSSRTKLTEIRN